MESRKAATYPMIERAIDRVADLVKRQDFHAALSEIRILDGNNMTTL